MDNDALFVCHVCNSGVDMYVLYQFVFVVTGTFWSCSVNATVMPCLCVMCVMVVLICILRYQVVIVVTGTFWIF